MKTLVPCPTGPTRPLRITAAVQFAKPLESLGLYLDRAELSLSYAPPPGGIEALVPAVRETPVIALHPGSGSPRKIGATKPGSRCSRPSTANDPIAGSSSPAASRERNHRFLSLPVGGSRSAARSPRQPAARASGGLVCACGGVPGARQRAVPPCRQRRGEGAPAFLVPPNPGSGLRFRPGSGCFNHRIAVSRASRRRWSVMPRASYSPPSRRGDFFNWK